MKTTATKLMVVLLSLMMTVSSFISFSFAEDPQDQTQAPEAAATAVESTPEPVKEETPAPKPVKESTPDPEPEPEPAADNSSADGGGSPEDVTGGSNGQQDVPTPQDDVNGNGTKPEVVQNGQDGGQTVQGEGPKDEEKKKEEEKKEEKKEDEKDRMPAQSFSGSAGGLSVRASAGQGVFPEGTEMSVSGVSSGYVMSAAEALAGENGTVVDAKAVDITFTKDGSEIQPAAGSVKVSLSANGSIDGEEHEAVHISGGSASSMGDASATSASFRADHFSIYGIIGVTYDGEVDKFARYTYIFKVRGQEVDRQIVRNGEQVTAPVSPADKDFEGWRVSGETANVSFPITANIPDTVTADQEISVEAQFTDVHYATFYKDAAKSGVLQVKDGKAGDTVTCCDVTFMFTDGRAIVGWMVEGSTTKVDSVTFSDGDISLVPILSEEAVQVTFDSRGGTPVQPVFVEKGQTVSMPAEPARNGYTFMGWFTDEACGQAYDFSSEVNDAFTLYAKWEGRTTSYKVAHWLQNAEDDNYTLKEIEIKTAPAGFAASYTAKSYTGFTLNAAKTNVTTLISGDGTTIKDVYYDRNMYPLTFYVRENKQWVAKETKQFRYGQDTSTFWNQVAAKYPDKLWYVAESGGTFWTHAPSMQSGGIKAYGKDSSGSTTIYYYEDGTNPAKEILKSFKVNDTGWSFTKEDYIDIPGFTYSRSEGPKNTSGLGILVPRKYEGWLYYTRNSYGMRMDPQNGSAVIARDGIKYEASLSAYKPANYVVGTTTYNFNGITKTFAGWYDNAECVGTPFDFNGKMPALTAGTNLMLYGKWVLDMHTVSFDLNGGTFDGANSITAVEVESGTQVTEPSGTLEKQDAVFGYWTLNGKRFSFDTAITSDITLVAHWNNNNSVPLTVAYNANGGTGTFTDSTVYQAGSYAKIAGQPAPPAGKIFTGWKVGNSDVIIAGGTFQVSTADAVNKVVTLTAQYADMPVHMTSVIYNLNGGNINGSTDNIVEENAVINGNYTVGTYAPKKDGFTFAGWNTDANGEGSTFRSGNIAASGRDSNILYAQWTRVNVKVQVKIKGYKLEKKYNGEVQEAEGFEIEVTEVSLRNLLLGTKGSEKNLSNAVSVKLKNDKKASRKDVGTTYMGLTEEDFIIEPADGYEVVGRPTVIDGSLTVTRKEVTVKADDKTKVLGKDDPELTATVSGMVSGDTTQLSYDLKRETGEAEGEYEITAAGDKKQGNYEVTYESGTFTITEEIVPPVDPDKPEQKGDYVPENDPEKKSDVLGDYEDDSDDSKGAVKTADSGKSTGGGPKTGDSSRMFLYIEILSLAVISLIILIAGRREEEESE